MRRKHCEVADREEMVRIMSLTNIGRMATIDADGYPYITPVNFVFHEGRVYFHCALKGEKLDNLARDPKVGFEVDVPLAYLAVDHNPEKNPCGTHQFYRSVVIRGTAKVLPNGPQKTAALNALVSKHEGGREFEPVHEGAPDYQACHVVEITPETMTGKTDLAQNKDQDGRRREIAQHLARRGMDGDLKAVAAMGYELDYDQLHGWRVK